MEKVKKVCADGLRAMKHGHGGWGPEDEPWTASTWRCRQASVHAMKHTRC
jgi:hypothetical protein